MKRRILIGAALVAALYIGILPAWADHSRPTGINCSNFTYQEDAQDYFNLHPGDPEGLDGPIGPAFDGIQNVACEALPHRPATTTTKTTTTTIAASGGSTSSGQTAIISIVTTSTTVAASQPPAAILALTG